jgi:5-methylcytosine-specific restriction endonuclease McrA
VTWYGGKAAAARDKAARSGARRRAREKAAPGVLDLTLDEIYVRDNGYCSVCRCFVPREQASVEHVVPLSKGGSRDPSNTKLAHRRCNSEKGRRVGPKRKGLRRGLWKRKSKPRDLPPDVF